MKFRVYAEMTTEFVIEIEADSEEAAREIGRETDLGLFKEIEGGHNWDVTTIDEVES